MLTWSHLKVREFLCIHIINAFYTLHIYLIGWSRDSPSNSASYIQPPLSYFMQTYSPGPTSSPSPVSLILTIALSPVFTWPLMILSAKPLPICFAMSLFKGRAPNLGSYPRSDSHCRTESLTSRVILRSSSLFWSSLIRISTISRKASGDRRLKMMNSSILFKNSGVSGIISQ